MASRHIPNKISDAVQEKHFFECAWCGTTITDRHHIDEFSRGGEHTVDNLILLCPTCHRQVHDGEISKHELEQRVENHGQGDRTSGSLFLQIDKRQVIAGGATFIDVPILIRYKKRNIIEFQRLKNNKFTINTRFYDINGNLIFWLNNNRYWTAVPFIVQSNRSSLFIKNQNSPQYLNIELKDNFIIIKGINFIEGNTLHFTDEFFDINSNRMQNVSITDCSIGIQIG
jgi:hypothetical protein